MLPHPEEVARDQGYYEHRAPAREELEGTGRIPGRVRDIWRMFWLAAAVLIGLFLWILVGPH